MISHHSHINSKQKRGGVHMKSAMKRVASLLLAVIMILEVVAPGVVEARSGNDNRATVSDEEYIPGGDVYTPPAQNQPRRQAPSSYRPQRQAPNTYQPSRPAQAETSEETFDPATDKAEVSEEKAPAPLVLDEGKRKELALEFEEEMERARVASPTNEGGISEKKFTILTQWNIDTKKGTVPVLAGQRFTIHLDKQLKVNDISSLPRLTDGDNVITGPAVYDGDKKTITYTLSETIKKDTSVPVRIQVDYDTKVIDPNAKQFTVKNSITGDGVPAKELLPVVVDSNGNMLSTITEPGGEEIYKILEYGQGYNVDIKADGIPVEENGTLVGIDWKVRVISKDPLNSLGFAMNFTAVQGSGLGPIEQFKIDNADAAVEDNDIKGSLGIVDSKHHEVTSDKYFLDYTFYTPVTNKQASYMLDLSAILKNKNNKTGAKRLVLADAYDQAHIEEATPTRVGMNNRTTIEGKFTSESGAKWTITDGIMTGDESNQGLPLATRDLGGNQTITSGKMAVYKIDTTTDKAGKMVEDTVYSNDQLEALPGKETNPNPPQDVGTIAVYQINTNLNNSDQAERYGIAEGLFISKYQDLRIFQEWNLVDDTIMPAEDFKIMGDGKELGTWTVKAGDAGVNKRYITVPGVKYWEIVDPDNPTAIKHQVVQNFNKEENPANTEYYENYNAYRSDKKYFHMRNTATKTAEEQQVDFSILKVDKKEIDQKLAGATYKLLGANIDEVTTDSEGRITFKNIPSPGNYTLVETKAPAGYKNDNGSTEITVTEDGEIKIDGSNATLSGKDAAKQIIYHDQAPNYKEYMNAMHYGKIDADGNLTFYLYLKPLAYTGGYYTDKDTRLNLRLPGVDLKRANVQVFDVDPKLRDAMKTAMGNEQAETVGGLGGDLIGIPNNNGAITGTENVTDSFTNAKGYQIKFPQKRFGTNWGFLVKVNAKVDGDETNLAYDWLTDNDRTKDESKIQKVVHLSKNTADNQNALITLTNEAFEKQSIAMTKVDEAKAPLPGVTIALKDADNKTLKTLVTDSEGKVDFGKKYGPGNYTIEEISAPTHYEQSKVIFAVTVGEDGKVTYKAKFKDGVGEPVKGEDYFIDTQEVSGGSAGSLVDTVSQNLTVKEDKVNGIGSQPGVWEAYRYESLKYEATIHVTSSDPANGDGFTIQFDPNLDLKQYVKEFPKAIVDGREVADPYFDFTTNRLTYKFNQNSLGGPSTVTLNIVGIIPDKYYAQHNGEYPFKITVAPEQGNKFEGTFNIEAFYDYYDNDFGTPSQLYYLKDIYKGDDGNDYFTVMAYYNPLADYNGGSKTLGFNWLSTDYGGKYRHLEDWQGVGVTPAFSLTNVKIYRTLPRTGTYSYTLQGTEFTHKVNYNMPLSVGVRPERDPFTYTRVFNEDIGPGYTKRSSGDFNLTYDPDKVQSAGGIKQNKPLEIRMPGISRANEGYLIEQTFRIDDHNKWLEKWRAFHMTNGNLKSTFVNKPNSGSATAEQTEQEIPKTYRQVVKLINRKYTPGEFRIDKFDEATNQSLAGATFTLTDSDGKVVDQQKSNAQGRLSFTEIAPGNYTLIESQAPEDYIKSDKTWNVSVDRYGKVTITELGLSGSSAVLEEGKTLRVSNKPEPVGQTFKIYKKDGNGTPLSGAEFTLTKTDGTVVDTYSSDSNGVVEIKNLTKGETYLLKESQAPAGYQSLGQQWVLVVGQDGKVKVYDYAGQGGGTTIDNLIEKPNTYWVNIADRDRTGWSGFDDRNTGYFGLSKLPNKIGSRIVAVNKDAGYVIQRYVINPESKPVSNVSLVIGKANAVAGNMDWYNGEDIKVYELEKAVTGAVENIRLAQYGAAPLTNFTQEKTDSNELKLTFGDASKPIVVDVKVPYKDVNGGVGTVGYYVVTEENGSTSFYPKTDYYESISGIVEGQEASQGSGDGSKITGAYISEGILDVTNQLERYRFSLKKIKEKEEGAPDEPIQGAEFRLTGPGTDKTITTGKDGLITFDDLAPGEYTLKEETPAPGYKPATTDWTITITDEGKVFMKEKPKKAAADENASTEKQSTEEHRSFRVAENPMLVDKQISRTKQLDNFLTTFGSDTGDLQIGPENIPGALRADGFENVDPARSEGRRTTDLEAKNGSYKYAETKLTEINKKTKRFKQVFWFAQSEFGKRDRRIEIHSEPEKFNVTKNSAKINVYRITGTLDNWKLVENITSKVTWNEVTNNGKVRLKAKVPPKYDGAILVEVETGYDAGEGVGLGSDYYPSSSADPYTKYWVADSYPNEDSINKVASEYTVTVNQPTGGTISADKQKAKAGETVSLRVDTTDNDWEFESFTVTDSKGNNIQVNSNNQFTMPDSDVTVTASFKKKETPPPTKHKIEIFTSTGGEVTAVPTTASKGEEVTLNVKPDTDYKLKSLSVTDQQGSVPVNNNTFTMRDSDVTVTAVFEKETPHPTMHTVNLTQPQEGGTISAMPTAAAKDEIVTLSADPEEGWKLAGFTVTANGQSIPVTNNTFTMPDSDVSVTAKFEKSGVEITDDKIAVITNKQTGLDLKIYKKAFYGKKLPGAEFTLIKTESDYETKDPNFPTIKATSGADGGLVYKDSEGKVVDLRLPEGYYVLTEDKSPDGYKKVVAPWKIHVKEENGQLVARYYGPEETPSTYVSGKKAKVAGFDETNLGLVDLGNGIKYASRVTSISPAATEATMTNPKTKISTGTFVQRIYVDTTATNQTVNLQISPKDKREEMDYTDGTSPTVDTQGVKTAYRTTYRLSKAPDDIEESFTTYDLSKPGVTMVNTARWRPFDWGFDEDQLNLEPGRYIIDVEGYYDEDITKGEDPSIDIKLDFYSGKREFKQAFYNETTGQIEWKTTSEFTEEEKAKKVYREASFQDGDSQLAKLYGKAWLHQRDPSDAKYENWLSRHGGKIEPALSDTGDVASTTTQIKLKSLYSSDTAKPISKDGMTIINEEESYKITFAKLGKENDDMSDQDVANNRLEGGIFKLQQEIEGDFVDLPGSYVSSAFNGYFGFRDLKPGRYRLVEVSPPPGYKPIKDPLLYMTIVHENTKIDEETGAITPGRGKITLEYGEGNKHGVFEYKPENGELADFVTSATAKNMGKVINTKPGKGSVTVKKVGEDGKTPLKPDPKLGIESAKFKLIRLSPNQDEKPFEIRERFIGADGTLTFDNLGIGNYRIIEIKPHDGHINTNHVWNFTVGGPGLDPYANDSAEPRNKDLTSAIQWDGNPTIEVQKTMTGDKTDVTKTIYPHKAQNFNITSSFKVDPNVKINAGDYFKVQLTDSIDLEGIYKDRTIVNLDIYNETVGTIAKAKYNKVDNTITYTFTRFADQYTLESLKTSLAAWINLDKITKTKTNVPVGISLMGGDWKTKKYKVDYALKQETSWRDGWNFNITGKIYELDPNTGKFVQYYYINRQQKDGYGLPQFYYGPNQSLKNVTISISRLYDNTQLDTSMPESFAVPEQDSNRYRFRRFYRGYDGYSELNSQTPFYYDFYDAYQYYGYTMKNYDSYIVKIEGTVEDINNAKGLETAGELVYNYDVKAGRYDQAHFTDNKAEAEADLSFTAVNPPNEIKFKKTDTGGKALPGAVFYLSKKVVKDGKVTYEDTGRAKTSGEDGIFTFSELKPGEYQVKEKTAPTGYVRNEGIVKEFVVNDDGRIMEKVPTKDNPGALEEVSPDRPINVVNHKPIQLEKRDAVDKTFLAGAEFDVYYKEKEDGKYDPYKIKDPKNPDGEKITYHVVVGEDGELKGKVSLKLYKSGYYALKETKVPKGYTKPPMDFVKEFRLEDDRFSVKEKGFEGNIKKQDGTTDKDTSFIWAEKSNDGFYAYYVINPSHDKRRYDKKSNAQLRFKDLDVRNVDVIVINKKGGRSQIDSERAHISYSDPDRYPTLDLYSLLGGGPIVDWKDIFSESTIILKLQLSPKTADQTKVAMDTVFTDQSTTAEASYEFDRSTLPDYNENWPFYFDHPEGPDPFASKYNGDEGQALLKKDEARYNSDLKAYLEPYRKEFFVKYESEDKPVEVLNYKGTYPFTGGFGPHRWIVIIGAIIAAIAAEEYIRRKRSSAPKGGA